MELKLKFGPCEKCVYWENYRLGQNIDYGVCQRFPPFVYTDRGITQQPHTHKRIRCGEFIERYEEMEQENRVEKKELIRLLFLAEALLKTHWDMDSWPLSQIKERLMRDDAKELEQEP